MTTRPRLVALAVTALVLLLALVFVAPARSVPEPTSAPLSGWTPVAAPRSAPENAARSGLVPAAESLSVAPVAAGSGDARPVGTAQELTEAPPSQADPRRLDPSPVAAPGWTEPSTAPGRVALAGVMSWYCGNGSPCTRGYPAGSLVAAAGPALRVGSWRGRTVTVTAAGRSVRVVLVDWCQCHGTRLVDAYAAVWLALGLDLRTGLATVEVAW